MDTEKLYDQDAFLREFDAVVTPGGYRGGRSGSRGPRGSSVPERTYAPRDAESAAPVAPKRTERVDDFADLSFGKIEL